jgi:hypothetical protein
VNTLQKRSRAGKTMRVPRTRAGGEWSEAAFWGFLRSGLRQLSRRWPPLVRIAVNAVRRPSQSGNKRQKWEYQCADCDGWFMRKNVEVDHMLPCGSLRSLQDIAGFIDRLFCEPDGLRVLCDRCHAVRTQSVRTQ